MDNSSTFFSLIILRSCGKRETEVKRPATMPITDVVCKNSYLIKINYVCNINDKIKFKTF